MAQRLDELPADVLGVVAALLDAPSALALFRASRALAEVGRDAAVLRALCGRLWACGDDELSAYGGDAKALLRDGNARNLARIEVADPFKFALDESAGGGRVVVSVVPGESSEHASLRGRAMTQQRVYYWEALRVVDSSSYTWFGVCGEANAFCRENNVSRDARCRGCYYTLSDGMAYGTGASMWGVRGKGQNSLAFQDGTTIGLLYDGAAHVLYYFFDGVPRLKVTALPRAPVCPAFAFARGTLELDFRPRVVPPVPPSNTRFDFVYDS